MKTITTILLAALLAVPAVAADTPCPHYPELTAKDSENAKCVKYIQTQAKQGEADAQYLLGRIYFSKQVVQGIAQDLQEAFRWFHKSAEQGNARAQVQLSVMYGEGVGVAKDLKKAFRWNRLAAEQGNAKGQHFLGWVYENGEGVKQDDHEAVRWYRAAAEQGYVDAQVKLALMYDEGKGVPQDDQEENDREATRWYRAAAEQGNADAQSILATHYFDGIGVEQDKHKAAVWAYIAASLGSEAAKALIPVFEAELTIEEQAAAFKEGFDFTMKILKKKYGIDIEQLTKTEDAQ